MKKNWRVVIYKILAGIFAIVGIGMIFCFLKFCNGLSNDSNYWVIFSSYFSVVVAIANLVFFIIITIYVAQLQDKINENQMEHQNKLHMLDYKWKRIEDLNTIINDLQKISILDLGKESDKLYSEVCKLHRAINLFYHQNFDLFCKDIDYTKSENAAKTLRDHVKEINKTEWNDEDIKKLNDELKEIDVSLIKLSKELQKSVTE